jgi:hypothetical protein
MVGRHSVNVSGKKSTRPSDRISIKKSVFQKYLEKVLDFLKFSVILAETSEFFTSLWFGGGGHKVRNLAFYPAELWAPEPVI